MMRSTLLALLLYCGISMGGEQSAKLGEAFAVAPPAKYQPQYFGRAAWSPVANVWLVVWQDGVPTDDGTNGEGPAQNILAVRVSVDGKVLDATPIEVSAAKGAQLRPSVSCDGKDFLVVWHDFRNGKDWDLYAARVTGDGKLLNAGGTLIAGGEHNQCFADVVFGGGKYYVAWLDMRHWPEYRVYGSRVSPDGKVLDAGGVELVRVMTDKEMEVWKKAPFSPGKQGIGWHNFGQKGMSGMNQPGPPNLAANGKIVVVTTCMNEEEPSGHYAIRTVDTATGKPAEAQGEFALPANIERSTRNYWVRQRHVEVGEKGFLTANSLYGAGFGASGDAFWLATFLDENGQTTGGKDAKFERIYLDQSQVIPPGYRTYGLRTTILDLAWDGKRALYVAEHHSQKPTPGDIDILAIFVNAEGKRLADPAGELAVDADPIIGPGPVLKLPEGVKVAPFRIAAGSATQSAPAAAAGPEGRFLVIWQEESPDQDSRIMARVVSVK